MEKKVLVYSGWSGAVIFICKVPKLLFHTTKWKEGNFKDKKVMQLLTVICMSTSYITSWRISSSWGKLPIKFIPQVTNSIIPPTCNCERREFPIQQSIILQLLFSHTNTKKGDKNRKPTNHNLSNLAII